MRSTSKLSLRTWALGMSLLGLGACAQSDPIVRANASTAAGESELAAFPGFGASPLIDERRYDEEALLRERLIAMCMQMQGKTYVIVKPDSTSSDPNEAAAQAMEPDAREAFYLALYGVDSPNDPSLGAAEERKNGGCLGQAHRQLPGIFRVPEDLRAARDALDRDRDKLRKAKFEECMSSAGVDTDALRAAPLDATVAQKSANQACVASANVPDDEILRLEKNFVAAHRSTIVELTARRDAELESARKRVGDS